MSSKHNVSKTKMNKSDTKRKYEANSSFIFTVFVKSVPFYHFKLAYVVLHMAVKEFFEAHF